MKNINVLLDTNILLDWLLGRKPYADNAIGVLKLCNTGTINGYVAAHSIRACSKSFPCGKISKKAEERR